MTRSLKTVGVDYILRNLRARDREELAEYGIDFEGAIQSFETAPIVYVFNAGDRPAAVIAFHPVTCRTVQVSLMATERWPQVVRDVLHWSRGVKAQLLAQGFTRAECRTMSGHDDAIRFLFHLGFKAEVTIEGYGQSGRTFIQYAWTLKDHRSACHLPVSP